MEKYGKQTDSSQAVDLLQAEVSFILSHTFQAIVFGRLVVVGCLVLLIGNTLGGERVTLIDYLIPAATQQQQVLTNPKS